MVAARSVSPWTAVLDLLAPARCGACGARASVTFCPGCEQRLTRIGVDSCRRCGAVRTLGHGCWPAPVPIVSTRAVYDYRGAVARAIVGAKLAGARAVWTDLAVALAARVAQEPPAVDVVAPVATARGRARRRGVDHAAVLAQATAAAIGVPAAALLQVVGRPPSERQRARQRLPGSSVLLVDDVLTTGRTALDAASALQRAGAGEVHLAVLARAGDHPLVGQS